MNTILRNGLLSTAVLLIVMIHSCKKETFSVEDEYSFVTPFGFPDPNSDPSNPMSKAGVELGRYLYYDTALSFNGPREGSACASCHFQEYGFTLPDQNVLPHCNLAWSRNFLWRGEFQGTLEDIMLFEVNDFFVVDMEHLRGRRFYQQMFRNAFGSEYISDTLVAKALAQFIRTLVSSYSKYDRFLKGEMQLTSSELRGRDLFFSEKGDCFHCHGNALFSDNDFHNIGLNVKSQADMGRYLVTGASMDIGKFKTPSLRNAGLRKSFMHDGRFKTLKEVIRHYNTGIRKSEYLDPLLDKPSPGLTESEIEDLEAFILSLTDQTFITEKAFSNPFKP